MTLLSTAVSDVSAVVLTMGEPSTGRALASLACQTLSPADTILVESVSPFHRALNTGAQRVRTPHFVQVDSDMILAPRCLEELRQHMTPTVGMVVGALWDPLIGPELGVKLFRRECFDVIPTPNTLSPDTDFNAALDARGWEIRYVLPSRYPRGTPPPWPTLGEHRPSYTPLHAFARYQLLGARYVYRSHFGTFQWRYRRLCASRHPSAFIARIAFAHGLFMEAKGDVLTGDLYTSSPDFEALDRFLGSERGGDAPAARIRALLEGAPSAVFETFSRLAIAMRRRRQSGTFRAYHRVLDAVDHPNGWAARVALAHGLFIEPGTISAAYARIRDFLPRALGGSGSVHVNIPLIGAVAAAGPRALAPPQ